MRTTGTHLGRDIGTPPDPPGAPGMNVDAARAGIIHLTHERTGARSFLREGVGRQDKLAIAVPSLDKMPLVIDTLIVRSAMANSISSWRRQASWRPRGNPKRAA